MDYLDADFWTQCVRTLVHHLATAAFVTHDPKLRSRFNRQRRHCQTALTRKAERVRCRAQSVAMAEQIMRIQTTEFFGVLRLHHELQARVQAGVRRSAGPLIVPQVKP